MRDWGRVQARNCGAPASPSHLAAGLIRLFLEADMERYFREGMQSTVGGGTSQIMRTIIAQSMKK